MEALEAAAFGLSTLAPQVQAQLPALQQQSRDIAGVLTQLQEVQAQPCAWQCASRSRWTALPRAWGCNRRRQCRLQAPGSPSDSPVALAVSPRCVDQSSPRVRAPARSDFSLPFKLPIQWDVTGIPERDAKVTLFRTPVSACCRAAAPLRFGTVAL